MGLGKKKQNGKYEPISRYEGSWVHEMEQRRDGIWKGPPLVKPQPYDALWVTLGPCDSKGNRI